MFRRNLPCVIKLLIVVCLSVPVALCQSDSLALSSASVAPGGTASLSLSLTTGTGSQPAGLEWTVAAPASAVVAITAAPGPAASAAGKSISCAGGVTSYKCILSGLNSTAMQSGVVATLTLTMSTSATTSAIGVTGPIASSAAGLPYAITASGGQVVVIGTVLSGLSCNVTSLTSGLSTSCTATISQAAPASGTAIGLSSSSAALIAPASVTIAAGATSASFAVTAGTVSTSQNATLTATLNGASLQVSFLVAPAVSISFLGCKPSSLVSGGSTACKVALSQSLSFNISVTLTDNDILLTIPGSVVVPAGSRSAKFTALAGTIPVVQTATITASLGPSSRSTQLSLSPLAASPRLISLACDKTVVGGGPAQCVAHLSGAAPAGGVAVELAATSSAFIVPRSLQVQAGATMASFLVSTRPVDGDLNAALSARSAGSITETVLSLSAVKPVSVACAPSASTGRATCEVQLSARPPVPVSLAVSGSRNVLVPPAILTRSEQSSLTFEAVLGPSQPPGEIEVQVAGGGQTAMGRTWITPVPALPQGTVQTVFARFGELLELKIPTDGPPSQPVAPVSDLPPGARFEQVASRLVWTPARSQEGSYVVSFSGQSAATRIKIVVGSGEPIATALVNAASQDAASPACAPGSVASLQGGWLNSTGAPRVYVNGTPAPVLAAGSTRVDFLCPQLPPGTLLRLWLENDAGKTAELTASLTRSAPAIFTLEGSGQGRIFLSNSLLAAARRFGIAGEPAQPGDEISIRATGVAPGDLLLTKIGDIEVPVSGMDPAPDLPGVYDVHVTLPAGVSVGDAVPVRLQVIHGNDSTESSAATMTIELPRP